MQQAEVLLPFHWSLQIQLGFDSPLPEAVEQWKDTMAHPEKVVSTWHRLSPV